MHIERRSDRGPIGRWKRSSDTWPPIKHSGLRAAKDMNSVLSGLHLSPFRTNQWVISSKPDWTSLAKPIWVGWQLKMAPSSTYMLRPRRFHVRLISLRRGDV